MKKQIRIFALIVLCLIVASSFSLFTACQSADGEYNSEVKIVEKIKFQGVHDFTAPDTDKDLVKEGATEYKIVVAKNPSSQVSMAQSELITFFAEATGIRLQVVEDTELTHNASNKYISLGDNALFASSGITVDKKALGNDGLRIITKDQTVYIVGGLKDYSVIYGVYDLLQIYFGLEFYYEDCYVIDRNVKDVKLKDFNVTDIPDIATRGNGNRGNVTGDLRTRWRHPFDYGQKFFPIHKIGDNPSSASKTVHNVTYWIPSENSDVDTKWLSDAGAEALCYTAHGDEESLTAMVEYVAVKALKILKMYPVKDYPDYSILGFTMEDTPKNCTCQSCRDTRDYYGAYSGALVKFMNRFRTRLDQLIAEQPAVTNPDDEWRRDDLVLTFFMYMQFEKAPSKHLDELKFVDGLSGYFAMNASFDFQQSIYADVNENQRKNFETWMTLGDKPLIWTYSTKFTSYLLPCDTFSFYNEDAYNYFASFKPVVMYNQSQSLQQGTTTAFHNLKAFLEYKMMWDSTLDAEPLIDDYMDAMFGPASATMKELYTRERLQAGIVRGKYSSLTILGNETDLNNKDFWPYPVVKEWLALCDKAYSEIEKYKEIDSDLYQMYKTHIDTEWVCPSYMALKFYSDYMEISELKELQATFKKVILELGISNTHEINGDISSFIAGF